MVEIKNYCKSIKSRPILNNVSYNFEYGKIYGIYGHNGSGKTMLLRAIAGLLVPDSGSVVIDGKVLRKDIINFIFITSCLYKSINDNIYQ